MVTVLEYVLVYGWLAGVLVVGAMFWLVLRHPDAAGIDRLTVSLFRAHPYAAAFLLALAAFTWPVSVPVMRYMTRQGGGDQP